MDVEAVVGAAGWATRAELLGRISARTLSAWVTTGRLVRLQPGVLATPAAAGRWRVRVAAALAGRAAVAGHGTALALWELVPPPAGPLHLVVEGHRSGRGSAGVVLHRDPAAYADRRRADGFPVTSVERAVVDAWGSPGPPTRADVRAAALTAVRRRLCRPADLAHELARSTRLPGRAELVALVGLLDDGCRSELEIWGCTRVLRGPGMPPFTQQRRISVGGETFVLDAAYEEAMLAVEMDGAAWHGSNRQREADIRRDALVATAGWQTLRFGYRRLTGAPDACRRDILAVYRARLRLLRGDGVRAGAVPLLLAASPRTPSPDRGRQPRGCTSPMGPKPLTSGVST
jgi:very-short-patch-repair endonuclease